MTQDQQIDKYLSPPGRRINSYKAIKRFGITRLAAICHRLKRKGKPVRSELKKGSKGVTYAEYYYA